MIQFFFQIKTYKKVVNKNFQQSTYYDEIKWSRI